MAPSRAAARKHTPSGRVRGGHVKLQTIRIFIRNLTPALLYARQVWSESRRKKTPGCAWGFNLGPRPQQEDLSCNLRERCCILEGWTRDCCAQGRVGLSCLSFVRLDRVVTDHGENACNHLRRQLDVTSDIFVGL